MKVLEINSVYSKGSTGLIVKDIGELLKKEGYEVRYAYASKKCNDEDYQIGSFIDWKIHALYTRITGKQGWGSKRTTKRFLSYMNSEKPDIVHLHNLHSNYINLPMLLHFLAENNITTVITLHDCWFFTGKCCHFTSVKCNKWKGKCGNCPKLKETPKSLIFDSTTKVIEEKTKLFHEIKNLTVVGCSKWISSLARESCVFHNCNIIQIYNGIDTNIFYPRNQRMCKEKIEVSSNFVILGMANKWLDERNNNLFNECVRALNNDELLILVGCNQRQLKVLKRYNNVKAIPFIYDRNKLAEYYNAADVFVNPTFEDTLPTVNMESICCGTPVITYDSCGSGELILDGFGKKIQVGDWLAINKAIKTAKIERHRISCEHSRNFFDSKIVYKKYVELFCNIIKKQ